MKTEFKSAEEWSVKIDTSLCEHEKWIGIPEVDAICASCGISEMGLYLARTIYVELAKEIQYNTMLEAARILTNLDTTQSSGYLKSHAVCLLHDAAIAIEKGEYKAV